MLWRLVARLLLKATVPFIAIAGVLTYGVYMRGGDPAAMWTSIAGKSGSQITALISGVKNDATQAASTLTQQVGSGTEGENAVTARTEVYTWKDAQGVTHYSTSAPTDADARTVSVNPNVNVLAPVRAPVRISQGGRKGDTTNTEDDAFVSSGARSASSNERSGGRTGQRRSGTSNSAAIDEVAEELGGTLPGVAGQVLSTQGNSGSGSGAGSLDPSQLIRMLQSSGN